MSTTTAPENKCPVCHRIERDGKIIHAGNCNTPEAIAQIAIQAVGPNMQDLKNFLEGKVSSTSDQRVVNNVMRHEYRVLTDREKEAMKAIKDLGLEFLQLLDEIARDPAMPTTPGGREWSLAKTKMEEAVMWAVKGLT